ncbi:hypothetical protein PpBr36_01374 [Pyricularia pennisetigena]|uniref:hypothetical protein n=1 Tax=Pyricularia pennisetigena TaxID=1578925 RepID=UPI00114DD900|nr:hypothetical protein PpBr36_01374 [Pyricularia pennisetigena]TLS28436.1 hypothetical protein PpBr36_01374 [Pyricularia pennisetigena]
MTTSPPPRVFPPTRPSELLSLLISQCVYPTTLVICSSRGEFMASLVDDFRTSGHDQRPGCPEPASHMEERHSKHGDLVKGKGKEMVSQEENPKASVVDDDDQRKAQLLAAPLFQVAISRHIRVVFVPTVSHLRAFLAVFSTLESASKVRPPPAPTRTDLETPSVHEPPWLLVYDFLALHRDTSEWSAQGIGFTAASLVEAAHRNKLAAVIVEAQSSVPPGAAVDSFERLATEDIPVLSVTARRLGQDGEVGNWIGRTVPAERVLGRWFRFQRQESLQSYIYTASTELRA